MSKPPSNYLLWEGLPFFAAIAVQGINLMSDRYRELWWSGWFIDSDAMLVRAITFSFIIGLLGSAAIALFVLRKWWPAEDAFDRAFRIVFLFASALFLTFLAAVLINFAPFFIGLELDGQAQESEGHSY